jgi:hypothetical protein
VRQLREMFLIASNIHFSGHQLPPGHDPGADSGEAPNGQYPGLLTGPLYPMPALSAARPLGPSLQRTTNSAPADIRVA